MTPEVLVAGFGASDASPTLLQCRQLAEEFKDVARRAVGLHRQVSFLSAASCSWLMKRLFFHALVFPPQLGASPDSPDAPGSRHQMAAVLQEAFDAVRRELQGGRGHSAPCGQREDDRMMLLLEKYSEELVQVTRNKLDRM